MNFFTRWVKKFWSFLTGNSELSERNKRLSNGYKLNFRTKQCEMSIRFPNEFHGSRYELREPVTHEPVDTTYGYIINDPYTMATTIACVTYDNFRNKQTEPFRSKRIYGLHGAGVQLHGKPFLRTMIENVVEYAVKTKGHTKDDIVYFLEVLIPEIKFGEIAIFTSESLLIPHGKYITAVTRLKWEVSKCR